MTIAKGRVSIFTFPRFLGFGRIVALHWPTRMDANFVAKNPRAYVGGKARTVAFWGGGYIEPGPIGLALDLADARRRVETLVTKGPPPHDP
jgi:hypothetical protein